MSTIQLQDRSASHLKDADADLSLRLRIALSVNKRAGWHLVQFTAENGVVQLAGVVPTFYDRQLIVALVRRIAGVFHIKDHLTVGDPSIRQQVIDTEKAHVESDPASNAVPVRDPFRHITVLQQSLDDLLVGPAVSALHAI
jgi:hypothetical protein